MGRITCSLGCSSSREADIKTFHVITARTAIGICIKHFSLSPKLLVTQAKRVKCSILHLLEKTRKPLGEHNYKTHTGLRDKTGIAFFQVDHGFFMQKNHLILLKILSESISVELSSVVQWKVFFMSIWTHFCSLLLSNFIAQKSDMWETVLNVSISFVFVWKWKETKLELKYVKNGYENCSCMMYDVLWKWPIFICALLRIMHQNWWGNFLYYQRECLLGYNLINWLMLSF